MVNYEKMSCEDLAIIFGNFAYIPLLDKTTQPSYNLHTSTKIIQKKAISNEVFFSLLNFHLHHDFFFIFCLYQE